MTPSGDKRAKKTFLNAAFDVSGDIDNISETYRCSSMCICLVLEHIFSQVSAPPQCRCRLLMLLCMVAVYVGPVLQKIITIYSKLHERGTK